MPGEADLASPLSCLTETARPNLYRLETRHFVRVIAGVLWRALGERIEVEEHPQDVWAGHLRRGARRGSDGSNVGGCRYRECGQRQLGRRRGLRVRWQLGHRDR